ncbi:MAG: Eco57I restriction-modification methylase domain-containing protein, partial [Sediminibacterium sp.]|nr:Eco57I restriction-modification methylase domain-containing protein [Sediminibacterium sp.]
INTLNKKLKPSLKNNGGYFDIVIGNPPYIKEYTNKAAFNDFKESKYYQGKMDLWYGFACEMMDKLKSNGIQSFIAQNNWITSAGASKLREKILSDTQIKSFVDFGNYKVFESAGIQTMIYLIQKKEINPEITYSIKYSLLKNENLPEEKLKEFLVFDFKTDYAQKFLFDITPSSIKEKAFTFNTNDNEVLLNQIASVANYRFSNNEVAQGIVFPQDFLNKANQKILGDNFKVNEGMFALTKEELNQLHLTQKEKELIKPYYTTENFKRYYANPENKFWLIYTVSSFKDPKNIDPYPHIKQHLDRFKNLITSDNKPYGLHRARDERFFLDEKIIVQRKCAGKPVFTYTNFNTYVSATFYIIKPFQGNYKYLTALLNSTLIEFWLKNKGKMQGNNFQIDKEPLVNIPLIIPKKVIQFEILVDYIIYLNDKNSNQLSPHTTNNIIASQIEDVLNMMVYELYFETHMKEVGIDILQFINP